jgi:alkyldihydroxyacetonephosphate synthase
MSLLDRRSYARAPSLHASTSVAIGERVPLPDAIAWPATDDELRALIVFARERKVPLIPYGAGSSQSGAVIASCGGIVVDLKRFDAVAAVDPVERTVVVGAGAIGENVERRLAKYGFTLGHVPQSIGFSTVGGWLATRAAGYGASRYGRVEDSIVSVSGVFGTGECFETPLRPRAGADLSRVIMGAEGAFCIFTSVRFRVHRVPEARAFAAYEFSQPLQGFDTLLSLSRAAILPAMARLAPLFQPTRMASPVRSPSLLTDLVGRLGSELLARPRLVNWLETWASRCRLCLVFEGDAKMIGSLVEEATSIATSCHGVDVGGAAARSWFHRRFDDNFEPMGFSKRVEARDQLVVEVPWSSANAVIRRVFEVARSEVVVDWSAEHPTASGCCLVFRVRNRSSAAGTASVVEAMRSAAFTEGAQLAPHAGIGLASARFFHHRVGEGRAVLAALKRRFDPDAILNPGKPWL